VIFALPFTALRDVHLDPSLGLPSWKRQAIDEFGYAMNTKTMVSFAGPGPGSASAATAAPTPCDPVVQNVWETSPHRRPPTRGVLTDYASGDRAVSLAPAGLQSHVERLAQRPGGRAPRRARTPVRRRHLAVRAHALALQPHPPRQLRRQRPRHFTTIAGNEGKPVGNLLFAGEHADSFYEWQGYMEGACLSGIDAADAILADWG
jgi:monoamine oxidase